MVRPLRLDGTSALRQMSDADLDQLCYRLAQAFATKLNAGSDYGGLRVGSAANYSLIGSATDTKRIAQTASRARTLTAADDVDPDGGGPTAPGDWPAAPATANSTVTTYSYYQWLGSSPAYPSTVTLDADSYLYWTNSALRQAGNTESEIYDEIVAQTITDMLSGHEVGTYRVSTSNPGGGTWADKGTWLTDTTHSAGTTTYKLWLKTVHSSTPGSLLLPVAWDNGSSYIQERSIAAADNLVQNILLPVLQRRIVSNGALNYSVVTSITGTNRGSFVDSIQTGSTASYVFTDPTYFTTSTPSGASSAAATRYLQID